jgi:RNA polymerase sigma factor (sigma-70 family)
MNKKTDRPGLLVLNGGKRREDTTPFQKIISDHFPLIERQCFNAVKKQLKNLGALNNPLNIENEALELSNRVLDTLQRDDYRVLRQFKGEAKLSTYLTAIIARQAVDMVRKKLGRNREKERAQKLGRTGMILYERILLQGGSLAEIYPELKAREKISATLEELEAMLEKIRGKRAGLADPGENNPVVRKGTAVDEEGEPIIPDRANDPQELLIRKQRSQKQAEAVRDIISHLNGEERLILRMRFPADNTEKQGKVERIAAALGISEKAVYKRIARILKKCRARLDQAGVSSDEVL